MKHVVNEPETAGALVWIESFGKAQEWESGKISSFNRADAWWGRSEQGFKDRYETGFWWLSKIK